MQHINIHQIEHVIDSLGELERQFPGATAQFILYTSGAGAVRLDKLLALPPMYLAVDFDKVDEIDSSIERLRGKAAQTF